MLKLINFNELLRLSSRHLLALASTTKYIMTNEKFDGFLKPTSPQTFSNRATARRVTSDFVVHGASEHHPDYNGACGWMGTELFILFFPSYLGSLVLGFKLSICIMIFHFALFETMSEK